MAHKLMLGSVLGACVLLAGCQNTGGSRFASNQGVPQPVMAKQKQQMPPVNFPNTGTGTASVTAPKSPGFNTSAAGSVPTTSSTNPFPLAPATANSTANNPLPPLSSPPPLGPTNISASQGNVTTTAPLEAPPFPETAGAPSAPPPLSQPGITPLQQP